MPELPKDEVRALIAAWAEGDESALERLFAVYFRKIVNILRRGNDEIFINDGEDLVQEVFATLHRWLQAGHEVPRQLTLYLLTSARTLARNRGRRNQVPRAGREETEKALPEMCGTTRSALSTLGSLEMRGILRQAIERLPERLRLVYELRMKGLKEREIAEKLALALGTVKAYVHEGAELLKKDLHDVAVQISTWYQQKCKDNLTPIAIFQATQKIPWLYGDPVRLKHFEHVPDEDGASKLGLDLKVYRARLDKGYELLEVELGADFPSAFTVLESETKVE